MADNYQIQLQNAQKFFLSYDQEHLIQKFGLHADEDYLYPIMFRTLYRIDRKTGSFERYRGVWQDANTFGEVMTILDWLCDSRPQRYICGRWINVVSHGHYFHSGLQEERDDPVALSFSQNAGLFRAACLALGGREMPGGDVGYAIELLDGLSIYVQLWHGDDEFAPRLRFLWDENTAMYLRYETTWYAVGLLMRRIREKMEELQ